MIKKMMKTAAAVAAMVMFALQSVFAADSITVGAGETYKITSQMDGDITIISEGTEDSPATITTDLADPFTGNVTISGGATKMPMAVINDESVTLSVSTLIADVPEGVEATLNRNLDYDGLEAFKKDGAGTLTLYACVAPAKGSVIVAGTVKLQPNEQNEEGIFGSGNYDDETGDVRVKGGATLDMNGHNGGWIRYVTLEEGATFANTGNALGCQARQCKGVILEGDAIINAKNDFGILASGYAASELELGSYKLTNIGEGKFITINTAITFNSDSALEGNFDFSGSQVNGDQTLNISSGEVTIWRVRNGDKTLFYDSLGSSFYNRVSGNHSGKIVVSKGAKLKPCLLDYWGGLGNKGDTTEVTVDGELVLTTHKGIRSNGDVKVNGAGQVWRKIAGGGKIHVTDVDGAVIGRAGEAPTGLSGFTGTVEIDSGSRLEFRNWWKNGFPISGCNFIVNGTANVYSAGDKNGRESYPIPTLTISEGKTLSGNGTITFGKRGTYNYTGSLTFDAGSTLDASAGALTVENCSVNWSSSGKVTIKVAVDAKDGTVLIKCPTSGFDASKVVVTGATGELSAAVAGDGQIVLKRPFVCKIDEVSYYSFAEALAEIQAGKMIVLLKDSNETIKLPFGVILDKNGHTADNITETTGVAQIGEEMYETLQAAFETVQDGETITVLGDITFTEATVGCVDGQYVDGVRYTGDKSFTVDFNGKTVTDDGCVNDYLIYLNNNREKANEITFKNGTIRSQNGCWSTICVGANSSKQKTTLNLNGMTLENKNGVVFGGNCVVRARGLSVETTVNVNNGTTITSDGASYGATASTAAVVNVNEGAKIVQKNSANSGGNHTCAALGGHGKINVNDGAVITSDCYGIYTFTTGFPVVNVNGGTITATKKAIVAASGDTTEECKATVNISGGVISGELEATGTCGEINVSGGTFDHAVAEEFCAEGYIPTANSDGTFGVKEGAYVAQVGETKYETFAEALAAAEAGQTITLLADIESSEIITIDKAITLDGNGKTLTSTAARAINVATEANVTIKNLTVNCSGERGINVITKPANLTIEKCNITANNYAVNVAGSAGAAKVAITGGTLTGLNVVNVAGPGANVSLSGATINSGKADAVEEYAALCLNKDAVNGTITADNCTINLVGGAVNARNGAEGGSVTINGAAAGAEIVAVIEHGNYYNSYATLADAIAAATAGQTIKLIRDVTASEIIVLDKAITLDGNGKTLTSTAARAINVATEGNVTIKNLTVNCSGERGINVITEPANLTIEKCNITANNYAVNVASSAGAAQVEINGGTLTGLNVVNVAGPGANVSLSGATINSGKADAVEEYAALCLNKDAVNGKIAATDCTINLVGGAVNARNGAEGGSVTINGVAAGAEIVAVIEHGDYYNSYATLADAIAAATAGQTIKLIRDVTASDIIVLDKAITIDGNGKTLTSTATRAINVKCTGEVTIKNLEIVASTKCERAINIIEAAGTTNIENVKVSGDEKLKFAVNMANNVPAGAVVNIKNSELSAWKAIQEYASDSTLNVENSTLTGWAAIAIYGSNTTINVKNSYLVGVNTYPAAETQNTYSTVAVGRNTANVAINVTGGSITAESQVGCATQWVYGYNENCSIDAVLDTKFILVGENAKYLNVDFADSTLTVRAEYADAVNAEGFLAVGTGEGMVSVVAPVAQIGDAKYETLADALAAAQAGETIIILADLTLAEAVALPAGITLDLDGKSIDGTVSALGDITIVGGGYIKKLSSTSGGTIAVEENTTLALNDFSFGTKSNNTAEYTITGGKIIANYGFFQHGTYKLYSDFETGYMYYSYGSDITVYGTFHSQGKGDGLDYVRGKLTIAAGGKSIHDKALWVGQPANWGAMESALIVEEGGTLEIGNMPVYNGSSLESAGNITGTITKETDATIAISGGTYTQAIPQEWCAAGYVPADLGNGKYGVAVDPAHGKVASVTTAEGVTPAVTTYYTTFAEALAAVQAGDTLTLLADIASSEIIVVDKAITLDGNGKKLTSTAARAINVSGANGVTIKNLEISCTGERAINIIQGATNVTIDNVTATAANYTVNVATSAGAAQVAITNSTLTGKCTVNVSAAGAKVTIDSSTINCDDDNTAEGEAYAALSLNAEAAGGSIIATDTTVNVTEGSDSMEGRNSALNGTVTINGSTEGVTTIVAVITYEGSDYYHGFTSLAEAIEFAEAGQTITLLADVTITSKLVINKAVTIDGSDYAIRADENTVWYTVSGKLNIKTYKPYVEITASNVTLKDVTLDANECAGGVKVGTSASAVAENVVFDNVTVADVKADAITVYGSLITKTYLGVSTNSSVVDARNGSITAAEGTVFDIAKWFGSASPKTCDLTGAVDTEGNPYFVAYGSTTYYSVLPTTTVTDLTLLDDIELAANLSVKGTLDLNGKSLAIADGFALKTGGNLTITGYGTITGEIQLTNASHELTVAEGLNVTTTVADSRVVYADGKYTVVAIPYVAQVGDVKYESFDEAYAAVEAGETLTLLADITTNGTIVINKAITLNGNGKTLTSTAARAINVSGADGVTIKNLTINCTGERGINVIQGATNVTIDNVTATADNYAVNVASSAANAVVTVKNSDLTGLNVVNIGGAGANVTVTDTKLTNDNADENQAFAVLNLNKDATGGTITANDCTFTCGLNTVNGRNDAENGTITIDGSTDGVEVTVAYINYGNYYAPYTSLQAAIDAAEAGQTITLIRDISASEIIVIDKAITLDGNGKTLTSTAGRAINVDCNGNVAIKNLTVNCSGERGINVITEPANLTIEKCNITANNYAVNVAGSAGAAQVAITGGTLTGLNVVNVAGADADVTITKSTINCALNTTAEKYAALCLNMAATGATISVDAATVIKVGSTSEVARNGATNGSIKINGVESGSAVVAVIEHGNYYNSYATLADAIAAAQNGQTIKLIRNATEADTITVAGKSITLDLNGKTVSMDKTSAAYSALIHVCNGATLTVVDTGTNGKIVYNSASVSGAQGALVWNEGDFVLQSGTLETLGTWAIGYAVDVRPNAWGSDYADKDVTFVMNGGMIKTSDAAIRVAQNSSDSYTGYSASFTMNGGEINSAATGIFIQQLTEEYDDLSVTITGGSITGSTAPIRFFGAEATGFVNGENGSSLTITGGNIATGTGSGYIWLVDGLIRVSGDASLEAQMDVADVTVSKTFADSAKLAEGYEWVENSDGTFSLAACAYVAKIGDVEYKTLQAAIDAATADQTVQLIADVALTEMVTVAEGKVLTLDLNGKAITVPEVASGGRHIYALNNKGEMTITDTSAEGTGSISARGIYNGYNGSNTDETVNGAKMIIEGGKFVGLDSSGGAGVFNCAELIIEDGTFEGQVAAVNTRAKGAATINGGTFRATVGYVIQNNGGEVTIADAAVDAGFGAVGAYGGTTVIEDGSFLPTGMKGKTCHVVYVAGGANVTINGGTYKMNYPADAVPDSGSAVSSYYNGTLSITGGTFTSHFDNVSPVELSEGSEITGGTFLVHSGTPSSHSYVKNYLADGYELNESGTVVKKAVAQIGETKYTSLQEAIDAAQAGDTIALLENVTVTPVDGKGYGIYIAYGKKITLELNGKTISQQYAQTGNYSMIQNDGELVIQDSSDPSVGKITYTDIGNGGEYFSNTILNRGTVTLKSGTVENLSSATVAQNGYPYAIDTIRWGEAPVVDTIIEGGKVLCAYYSSMRLRAEAEDKAVNVTITGGEVYGRIEVQTPSAGVAGLGKLTITGGEIYKNNSSMAIMFFGNGSGANVDAEISGGTIDGSIGYSSYFGPLKDFDQNIISGGTYSSAVAEDWCAAGYLPADLGNGQYGVVWSPVAKIGDTEYPTLQAAVDAATEGQTITVIRDVEVTATVTVAADDNIILDLNGKTLSGDIHKSVGHVINNAGKLTVTNGTAKSIAQGGGSVFFNAAGATLTLEDLEVYGGLQGAKDTIADANTYANYPSYAVNNQGEMTATDVAFYTYHGAVASIDGGNAELTDVTIDIGQSAETKITSWALYAYGSEEKQGKITFNSGVVAMTKTDTSVNGGGCICTGDGGSIVVNGGTFTKEIGTNNGGAIYVKDNTLVIYGGTFDVDPTKYVADGCAALLNLDGMYVVGEEPTATVNNLGAMTIPESDYIVYGGSKSGDMPLNFVMQFLANQDAEDMKTSPYADWYADFVLTFEGLDGGSFEADGCYLAGYYGDFGWVKVPVDGMTIKNGVRYPVMLGVDMGQKYDYICESVKDFRCAMYLTPEVLAANPNLNVKLELSIVDNSKGEDEALDALADKTLEYVNVVGETEYDAEDFASYVAQIGETKYTSLTDAFAAAKNGDTITLLEDIETSETFTIADGVAITLDMNGKKITATDDKTSNYDLFYNYGELTVTGNGTIELTATTNREWNASSSIFHNRGGVLTINNGTFTHKGGTDMAFVIDNSANYFGDAKTTINNGTLTSTYTAIRNRMEQNDHGASGTAYLTINGGTIDGDTSAIWAQAASTSTTTPATGSITIAGGTIGVVNTARSEGAECMTTITGGTVEKFKGEVGELTVTGGTLQAVEILNTDGTPADYAITDDGLYAPAVAKIGDVMYASLQAAFSAATSGDTVKLIADVELSATVTVAEGKAIILDLNGKTINAAFNGESTTNHIYAFKNYGVLTITDSSTEKNGAINSRGNYNYGTLILEAGAINAIDGNGGYAVWNQANSTFTMNGGTVAATYEDDNLVDEGGYDATTVRVEVGAAFTMNDGVINNVSDFTFAIDNSGTTTVEGGTISSVHTTVRNNGTMTIDGGTFTCNGVDGETQHAVWGEAGTTTINGGTFDGKDTYNGFNVVASSGATVNITGGTFLPVHSGSLYGEGTIAVSGGTFFDAVPENRCAEGYEPVDNADGTYGVAVMLPEVEIADIKGTLTDSDPDLTFALNFAIKDIENLTEEYLEALMARYGDYYTDYVLTISGLTDESVTFNSNGDADGYLSGQYDAWSENWVSVPFENVTINNGQSLYIMEYAAELMNKTGLRFTLAEVAEIVQNFNCGVYFTPEFLAANPGIKVTLELKVFTEDKDGNKIDDISVATNNFDVEGIVAIVEGENKQSVYCTSLADAFAAAESGDTVALLKNVALTETVKVADKSITLDLNGKTVSGVCDSSEDSLIYIENTAALTVKDSATDGKLTFAQGSSDVGYTVNVKGALTLESGTIELTGSWSIGYAVDVRPNSWGTEYTNPSIFTMNGGNIVSSDGGVRIASSSAEAHTDVSASFVMNDGKIDAVWDGVFIQQSNATYDKLTFTMNDGTIESDLNPIRVYGPAPTGYVDGQECMKITLNGGTCSYTGSETREWIIADILRVGGGSSADTIIENGGVVVSASFATNTPVAGYVWVKIGDTETYKLAKMVYQLYIKMNADNEPLIGFKTSGLPSVSLKAATNLENPEWATISYTDADDDADEYFWVKPTLKDSAGTLYRFFKLAE